jgi:hypothetical protein
MTAIGQIGTKKPVELIRSMASDRAVRVQKAVRAADLTLIPGDANFSNVLLPDDPDAGKVWSAPLHAVGFPRQRLSTFAQPSDACLSSAASRVGRSSCSMASHSFIVPSLRQYPTCGLVSVAGTETAGCLGMEC